MTEIARGLQINTAEEQDEEEAQEGWEEAETEAEAETESDWPEESTGLDDPHMNEGFIALPGTIDPHALEDMVADSSLAIYFRDITRVPLLTAEQEVELATAYEKGEIAKQHLAELSVEDPGRHDFELDERAGEGARR